MCVGVTVRIMPSRTAEREDEVPMEVTEMSFILISKLGFNGCYDNCFW
jgi:hypothetical protein